MELTYDDSAEVTSVRRDDDTPDTGLTIEDLTVRHTEREDWLYRLMYRISPWYEKLGRPLPLDRVRFGVGFTTSGNRRRNASIGQCHYPRKKVMECGRIKVVSDLEHGTFQIIVRIDQDDTIRVSEILVHELSHVVLPGEGHKAKFRALVYRLGLTMESKNTQGCNGATDVTPEFIQAIRPHITAIGEYPHRGIAFDVEEEEEKKKKKAAAQGKAVVLRCPCGNTVRTSRKWADAGGVLCNNMECEEAGVQMEER